MVISLRHHFLFLLLLEVSFVRTGSSGASRSVPAFISLNEEQAQDIPSVSTHTTHEDDGNLSIIIDHEEHKNNTTDSPSFNTNLNINTTMESVIERPTDVVIEEATTTEATEDYDNSESESSASESEVENEVENEPLPLPISLPLSLPPLQPSPTENNIVTPPSKLSSPKKLLKKLRKPKTVKKKLQPPPSPTRLNLRTTTTTNSNSTTPPRILTTSELNSSSSSSANNSPTSRIPTSPKSPVSPISPLSTTSSSETSSTDPPSSNDDLLTEHYRVILKHMQTLLLATAAVVFLCILIYSIYYINLIRKIYAKDKVTK